VDSNGTAAAGELLFHERPRAKKPMSLLWLLICPESFRVVFWVCPGSCPGVSSRVP
jgi:hypothetical protein